MSETLPLSADRLRELYETFRSTVVASNWYRENSRRQLDLLERVDHASDEELHAPDMQQYLWESSDLGSVGAGRLVDTSAVYRDRRVTDALVALRRRDWPETPDARAQAIREAYDEIVDMICPRLTKRNPHAKLLRVFAALLPAHFHRCFDSASNGRVAGLVLGHGRDRVRGAVLVRDKLRQELGAEDGPAMHVERSIFCWWLQERYEELRAGADMATVARAVAAPADEPSRTPVKLWPFARQRKTMPAISGYVDTLLAMIQSCEGGASQDDVIMAMREEHGLEKLQARSFRYLMNTAKALGLLEHRDGLWWPSEAGEDALDLDESEVLVERMIERVFGMAQLLRIARRRGPLSRVELLEELRPLYAGLQTDSWPRTLLRWASSLDLMAQDAQRWKLTDYGADWAERLPKELPAAPAELASQNDIDDVDAAVAGSDVRDLGEDDAALVSWAPPSFAAIWEEFFVKDDGLRRFVFDQDQLTELHLAWHPPEDGTRAAKRFVILSGLSGTGKTAILIHYARIYCRLVGIDHPEDHCTVVAVSPDWRDPSALLGYVNALTPDPTYLREPTLAHLLAAHENPSKPYFLILDEMNLAHPEHYFAPFLSAMETGGRLDLHAHDSPHIDVPSSIPWPRNLFIGGTVNMDETTHSFSDKVLDRAFTIELWDVDLLKYFDRRRERDWVDIAEIDELYRFFIDLNQELANVRRHVGYRSVGEAIDFVRSGARAGMAPDAQALWSLVDRAVHAKVLPRLRGHDRDELRKALDTARQVCAQRGLTRCVSKLARMLAQLDETGVTRFFA